MHLTQARFAQIIKNGGSFFIATIDGVYSATSVGSLSLARQSGTYTYLESNDTGELTATTVRIYGTFNDSNSLYSVFLSPNQTKVKDDLSNVFFTRKSAVEYVRTRLIDRLKYWDKHNFTESPKYILSYKELQEIKKSSYALAHDIKVLKERQKNEK